MSEQDNRALVQRGYDAFGRGDIPALLELLAEDVQWETPGPPELPTAGSRRGRQQVSEFFETINSLYDLQGFEAQAFVAEGDRVVVLGTETARVKATGKVLNTNWAHAFTVRDGQIVAFQEYLDTAAVMAELRATPAAL